MRWDLVEKFEVLKKNERAVARRSFSGREDFFQDHFPGHPIVPQTLLLEMIAQTGGVLFGLGFDFKKEVILAKVEKASFPKEVGPPCELVAEAHLEEVREEGAWISGTVSRGPQVVARARLLLVTMENLEPGQLRSVVFSERFLKHFDIYRIARESEASSR